MEKGADLVSKAILGLESQTIVVNGKPYFLKPPTIKRVAGAALCLSSFDGESFTDMLSMMKDIEGAAKALSWFVVGDESLAEELSNGTLAEVVEGLTKAISMLGIEDFQKLSGLSKSVRRLIANQK